MVEVTIKSGDYLYDISRRHNVHVRSILSANPGILNPEVLPIGCRIVIPTSASSSCPRPHEASRKFLRGYKAKPAQWSVQSALKVAARSKAVVGVMAAAAGLVKLAKWTFICTTWDGNLGAKKRGVKNASVRERSAAMNGTIPVSSLELGPRKIKPLFQSTLRHNKGNTFETCRESIVVKFGDTLSEISSRYGLSVWDLKKINSLKNEVIIAGDVLIVEKVPEGRKCQEIRPGTRRTLRPLFSRRSVKSTQATKSMSHHSMGVGGQETKSTAPVEGRWKWKKKVFQRVHGIRKFCSPMVEGIISSPFGWRWGTMHEGVDLAADIGTPILASERGTVSFAGWNGGYGKMVAVQHEGGFSTRYAHCSVIRSHVGKHVSRGEVLAEVGSTGSSTGPHLHFEVRRKGKAMDPLHWVYL